MKKVFLFCLLMVVFLLSACQVDATLDATPTPKKPLESISGVQIAEPPKIQVGPSGKTIEQQNITKRLEQDNKPGSLQHLYIISAYSGQVILYSTVDGKVTSSGKRLSPYSIAASHNTFGDYGYHYMYGSEIEINGQRQVTSEVLQDDGTYGSSAEYLYWWDTKGIYHQHYPSGGQIIHISSQPISVKSVIINLNLEGEK